MKIRTNYVSNSSSSSFILAYDESFFGDLISFFKNGYFGCETSIHSLEDKNCIFIDDFLKDNPECKEKIETLKKENKKIIELSLDQEYGSVLTLLRIINERNGGNKLTILYGDDEE